MDRTRYAMLATAVAAQLVTVLMTWELWQVRIDPPNLPIFAVPSLSFGIWMVASSLLVLVRPKQGLIVHGFVIMAASIFDQFRMQPQILAIAMLMYAAHSDTGGRICRWYLASLWLWAGLHKLFSAHWFGYAGFWVVQSVTADEQMAWQIFWPIALGVASGEILAGTVAIVRPQTAALFCVVLHLGICLVLVHIRWNFSVLPWNVATAIVGYWLLRYRIGSRPGLRKGRIVEYLLATLIMVAPAGFYWGWLDHGYANVLYSDLLPRGLIVGKTELRKISGWGRLRVPFPCERRTLRKFFEQVGKNGDKLHILDPRPVLDDQYFVLADGVAVEIDRDQFFESAREMVAGVGLDDQNSVFWLRRWGKITMRRYQQSTGSNNLIAYGYTMDPLHYHPGALRLLSGLPNLEQLQLADCPVTDDHLRIVGELSRLTGIGLNNTSVTDEGLRHLESLSGLRRLEIENTQISPEGLSRLKTRLGL